MHTSRTGARVLAVALAYVLWFLGAAGLSIAPVTGAPITHVAVLVVSTLVAGILVRLRQRRDWIVTALAVAVIALALLVLWVALVRR